MADKLTPEQRSANMARIRSKDTKPEMLVRRAAHKLGYRYRLHRKNLPGRPDLVFAGRKAVIFVHGCFWHQHGADRCLDGRRPKSNTGYWSEKLDRNVARDALTQERLAKEGWRSLIIWECEIRDSLELDRKISEFLDPDFVPSNLKGS